MQKGHECVNAVGIQSKQRRSSSLVAEVKELIKEEGFRLDFKEYGRFRSALPQRAFVYMGYI